MKKVLIIHDDYRHQIFIFINYLLHYNAIIHTKIDPSVVYDCVLIDEKLIMSDEIEYLRLLKGNICHPGTMIISITPYNADNFFEDEIFDYADLRIPLSTFLTLYDRNLEDVFGTMWNLPIEWRLIKKSK